MAGYIISFEFLFVAKDKESPFTIDQIIKLSQMDVTKASSLKHSSLNKTSSKIPASKLDAAVSILTY